MKSTTLFSLRKLCAFVLLVFIASSGWADQVTWTASDAGYANQEVVADVTVNSNISLTFDKGTNSGNSPKYYTTGTAVRAYGGNTIAVTATDATITGISFTFGSNDGTNAITASTGSFTSPKWSGSASSVTFTIGGTSGNRRIAGIAVTYTTAGKKYAITVNPTNLGDTGNGFTMNGTYYDSYQYIANAAAEGDKISLVASPKSGYQATASCWNVYQGETPVTVTGSGNEYSFTMPAGAVSITPLFVTVPAGPAQLATPNNLQTTDITATSATLSWGAVANASSYLLNVADGDVEFVVDGESVNTNSYTLTGLAAGSEYYWTVTAIGDGVSYVSSKESEIAEFTTTAATVAYTVEFNAGTGSCTTTSLTEATAGAGVTLPAATAPAGWTFAGWADASCNTTTTAPTLYTATYTPSADCTLYAVYSKTEGSSTTATKNSFADVNGNIDDNISYASGKGSSSSDPFLSNGSIRLYQNGGYITISSSGSKMTSVSITTSATYASTTVGYSVDGADQVNYGTVNKSSTVTVNNLNCSSISFYCNGTDKNTRLEIAKISVTYGSTTTTYDSNPVVKTLSSIAVTGTPDEFWKGDDFNYNGITVTATYTDDSTEDVTAIATFSGYDMSTIGEQTVTVTYNDKIATYAITVSTIANTEETAYTVAEAKALIDAGKDLATQVYVKGIVSQVDSYNETYSSITYWISDDGTTDNQFEIYSGKGLAGADFTSQDDVQLGAEVIVYGVIKMHNSIYEFDKNSSLVSYDYTAPAPCTITWSVNGETTVAAPVYQGSSLVFPASPENVDDYVFMGWTASSEVSADGEGIVYLDEEATVPAQDAVTYYAVFAKATASGSGESITINYETENFPDAYGTANTFTEYTLEGINFKIQQVYVNGTKLQFRAQGNASGTGIIYNSEAIVGLQSVVIVYNSSDANKNFTLTVGTNAHPASFQNPVTIAPTISDNTYTFDLSDGNYTYFELTNGSGAGYLESITINTGSSNVTYSDYTTLIVVKQKPTLSFEAPAYTVEEGQEFVAPALVNENGVPVTYESSADAVATVAEDGSVTVVGAGETVITASFAGNEDYLPNSASYTLTVSHVLCNDICTICGHGGSNDKLYDLDKENTTHNVTSAVEIADLVRLIKSLLNGETTFDQETDITKVVNHILKKVVLE